MMMIHMFKTMRPTIVKPKPFSLIVCLAITSCILSSLSLFFCLKTRAELYGMRQLWNEREPLIIAVMIGLSPWIFFFFNNTKIIYLYCLITGFYTYRETGIWYVPTIRAEPAPTFEYIIITVPENDWRTFITEKRFEIAGIQPSLFMGIPTMEAQDLCRAHNFVDCLENNKLLAIFMTNVELWVSPNLAKQTEWLVVFEDDAVPLRNFKQLLPMTVSYHVWQNPDLDVVWLDTRNAFPYRVWGDFTCGMAGIAYRKTSLSKIYETVRLYPEMLEIDVLLANLCNLKHLNCAASMLVKESELGEIRTLQ